MKVEVKLPGLEGVLDTLKSLPPELVSKRGGPVLAALKKGAKVIQLQEKANLRAAIAHTTASKELSPAIRSHGHTSAAFFRIGESP